MANPDPSTLWVLRVSAVRASIETLGKQKIHPTLPMYLYLRLKAREGLLAEASAKSSELLSMIEMPGNPEKPYYFPMIDRGRRDVGPLPTFWRATNISGSWSAGSIRRQVAASWLADDNGHYAMPPDNADLALKNLLYGQRTSVVALGAFFLRDQVFAKDDEPTVEDLIDTFRERFGFPPNEQADFVKLFDTTAPPLPNAESWFEQAPAEVLEALIG